MLVWNLNSLINFIIKAEKGHIAKAICPFFYCPKIFVKTIDTVGDNDYKKKGIYVVREKIRNNKNDVL